MKHVFAATHPTTARNQGDDRVMAMKRRAFERRTAASEAPSSPELQPEHSLRSSIEETTLFRKRHVNDRIQKFLYALRRRNDHRLSLNWHAACSRTEHFGSSERDATTTRRGGR